jgi:hypothetical protein
MKDELHFSLNVTHIAFASTAPQMKTQLGSIYTQTTFGPLEPLLVENLRRSRVVIVSSH